MFKVYFGTLTGITVPTCYFSNHCIPVQWLNCTLQFSSLSEINLSWLNCVWPRLNTRSQNWAKPLIYTGVSIALTDDSTQQNGAWDCWKLAILASTLNLRNIPPDILFITYFFLCKKIRWNKKCTGDRRKNCKVIFVVSRMLKMINNSLL